MIRWLAKRRPHLDRLLSVWDRHRLRLPRLSLRRYLPGYDEAVVRVHEVPASPWSSPLADVVQLIKLALLTRPQRLLEYGSFRGQTALALARHLEDGARLMAVDRDPRHGGAYASTPWAARIDRRVGTLEGGVLADVPPGSCDLIFLDAGHQYAEVRADTAALLPLLAPGGHFVWHDYANWGKFNGLNGVPEFLHEFAEARPAAQIDGGWLGLHCPAWAGADAERYRAALIERREEHAVDPWTTEQARD